MEVKSKVIYINNKAINVLNWDYTILQISESIGISIPRFCYHEKLSIAGNCRMCMVEVKNSIKPVIACATSIVENMNIFTNSELVKISRENVLELLLINHPLDCPICDQGGECDLQDQSLVFGGDRGRFIEKKRSVEDKEFGPIVKTIMTRCIHCTRCIRYAEEVAGIPVIGTMGRGKNTEIGTYITTVLDSEIIGNIVDLCPVGALTSKPYAFRARSWELQSMDCVDIFDSLCSFLKIDVKGNEIMRILPRKNDLVNEEWISDKVRFFYEGAKVNRLMFPLVKNKINMNLDNSFLYSIVNCSKSFSYDLFINLYNRSKETEKSAISIIRDNINLIDLLAYRILTDKMYIHVFIESGFNCKKKISSFANIRSNWLLNSSVTNFINAEHLLLCNVNIKYECAVLNALLFKNIYDLDVEQQDKKIYYVGNYFKNTYNINHIGITNYTMMLLQEGKLFFCNSIANEQFLLVDSGYNSLLCNSIADYINTFSCYILDGKIGTAYLAKTSGDINSLELGILKDIPENKMYGLLIVLGSNELESLSKLPKSVFQVYMGHHIPKELIYDIYFPVMCFFETPKVNVVDLMPQWLNNNLISNIIVDRIVTGPGESDSYYNILNIIDTLYFSHKVASYQGILYNIQNIKNFFIFNNTYSSSIVYNKKTIDVFGIESTNLQYKWNSVIFYRSDTFSFNSTTLYKSYKNHIINNYIL